MINFLKSLLDFLEEARLKFDEHMKIVDRNRHWRDTVPWNLGAIVEALHLDANVDVESKLFINKVRQFQGQNGLKDDGILGPKTHELIVKSLLTDIEDSIEKIISATIIKESGGRYDAMNLDGEFKGLFDRAWQSRHSRNHPASGKVHIGLSFGIIQFTQDGGALGKFLQACAQRDKDRFIRIVGPTWMELLEVTTRKGPSGLSTGSLRGPRVEKVRVRLDDEEMVVADLWEHPWTSVFRKIGNDPVFQSVQRELALSEYLRPILPFLKERGLVSEKSVAVGFDLAVHRGVGGARNFIRNNTSLDDTELAALDKLAKVNVRSGKIVKDSSLTMGAWGGFDGFS
jgi:hypothetical protein